VPRTHDIWVGINRLKQMLPRFSFRLPHCERGLEALSNYHSLGETSTGIARDEPVHDWSSHASDAIRIIAEAEAAGMLSRAGSTGLSARRQPVRVITGLRSCSEVRRGEVSILDRFFGPEPGRPVRMIRWAASEFQRFRAYLEFRGMNPFVDQDAGPISSTADIDGRLRVRCLRS
jgi:hypothetical protein